MRVTFAQRPDANLIRGGAEVQVDRTADELRQLGVEVSILTSLDREVGDIVHFFGPWDCHYNTSTSLQKRGVPYVCSPIWSSHHSLSQERRRTLRKRLTGKYPRYLGKLFKGASALIVLTKWEQEHLQVVFDVEDSKFQMIPNGVDPKFWDADPAVFRQAFGVTDEFVLHCGSIYPDKNQLSLIRAVGESHALLFVGPTLDQDYLRACQEASGPNVKFIGALPNDSDLLPSAYAAAKVFCLPSKFEVLSLAALEAGAAGCKLVLSNSWGGQEHFGGFARYVDYRSEASIASAVEAAWRDTSPRGPQSVHFRPYSWSSVAAQLKELYEHVLKTSA